MHRLEAPEPDHQEGHLPDAIGPGHHQPLGGQPHLLRGGHGRGIYSIDVDPWDREKTAFATPFGSFQQKRLGFGVTKGKATYCLLVDLVLKDIPDSVAISFLAEVEDQIRNVLIILAAYRDAGLKLGVKKCTLFNDEITCLGHILNEKGICPIDLYVDAIKKWPLPRYKTEARAFLGGVTSYYHQHIPDYAKISQPWTDIIGKTEKDAERHPLEVTEEMEASFETLKASLVSVPILGFLYFRGSKAGCFILDTNFCAQQIASILSQDQDGREVVIGYGSKKLIRSQSRWPSTKFKLYTGIFYMKKYLYNLQYGRQFLWRTDNSILQAIRTMDCPGAIVERWLGTLADYNFEVQHRAGTKHSNHDGSAGVATRRPPIRRARSPPPTSLPSTLSARQPTWRLGTAHGGQTGGGDGIKPPRRPKGGP